MLGVVVSRADPASVHVAQHLRALLGEDLRPVASAHEGAPATGAAGHRTEGVVLRYFDPMHLDLTDVAAAFDEPALLAVASKHAGETGPLLTAHHTGNFGSADHGGAPRSLARAAPNALATAHAALREHAPADYEVGIEATHHGPTAVGAPSLYVEVGSGPDQWQDPDAARAAARAILALRDVRPDRPLEAGASDSEPTAARRRHLVGFGGGHYAPRFERVLRETDWAVGHVAPDWGLEAMGDPASHRAQVRAAMEASAAHYALLAGDRDEGVASVLADAGYAVVGETFLRETAGVPLGVVRRLERRIAPVAEGLRVGEPATGYTGDVAVVTPSEDLRSRLRAVDGEAVVAAARERTLAFGTDQNGNRFTGPVAVAPETLDDAGVPTRLIDALLELLADAYDAVRREGSAVVLEETAFDPALAREAGVPEGPAFGRLAAGEAVEVDGEPVTPAMVARERTETVPILAPDAADRC
jgi:D-aminoacyl-tRNA deacylase